MIIIITLIIIVVIVIVVTVVIVIIIIIIKCDVFTILHIQRASVAVMKLYINRSICSASSVFLCALLRGH